MEGGSEGVREREREGGRERGKESVCVSFFVCQREIGRGRYDTVVMLWQY